MKYRLFIKDNREPKMFLYPEIVSEIEKNLLDLDVIRSVYGLSDNVEIVFILDKGWL